MRERQTRRASRRHDDQLVMAGARARHAALVEIEHQTLQRHEHTARILFEELVVEAPQNLVWLRDVSGERAEQRHGHRHEERGGDSLS